MNTVAPVSVIVPAYKRTDLLREALASIRAQTLAPAEVILVDDGSPEELSSIAAEYGTRYIRRPNGGVGAARNTGIAAASQPWIALLDSDDVWLPEKLERQLQAVDALAKCDLVICNFVIFGPQGDWAESAYQTNHAYAQVPRRSIAPEIVALAQPEAGRCLAHKNFIAPSSLFVQRSLIDAVGGFDESLKYIEDHECWLRLFAVATPAAVEIPMMRYRSHGDTMSSNTVEMRQGDLLVAAKVAASPERYPAGAGEVLQSYRAQKLYQLSKGLMLKGDYAAARVALRESATIQSKPATLAALAFAHVGERIPSATSFAFQLWENRPWNPSPGRKRVEKP